ncbi:hypothetical protein [Paenibacillus sp. OSY-SE]|uniref:hypothetical protein n=1 Tax=Paenibacillus sp. OSY-SE TaxID=1196323 RepID=UPI000379D751|nr:hypothetical protein [Paenibacillus sp. OSY-SE]
MKHKKFISMFLVFAMAFIFSQSAFAAKGIGDTKETAINIFPKQEIRLFIEGDGDKDWFIWTNNTGATKYLSGALEPGVGKCRYKFGVIIDYNNGRVSDILFAQDPVDIGQSEWSIHTINGILIPPGATVYYVVESKNGVMEEYKISHRISDV